MDAKRFSHASEPKAGAFILEKVQAHKTHLSPDAFPDMATSTRIYYRPETLSAFQFFMRDSKLLNTRFYNPYLNDYETFPADFRDLTARHLQIIARNEAVNVTGFMKTELYQGLSANQIASIRCLVKECIIAGKTFATHVGGYPFGRSVQRTLDMSTECIVVDQSGLQFQDDFRNSGGLYFYPDDSGNRHLPEDYLHWQNDTWKLVHGTTRPKTAGDANVQVEWTAYGKKVTGKLNLAALEASFQREFQDSLYVTQEEAVSANKKVDFRFLRAGLGFFSSGLSKLPVEIEIARLKGILSVLEKAHPQELNFIQSLMLPHTEGIFLTYPEKRKELEALFNQIEKQTKRLNISWAGAGMEDYKAGGFFSTTNCADPHAAIGNEGGQSSVDASFYTNMKLIGFNPGFNRNMQLAEMPQPGQGLQKARVRLLEQVALIEQDKSAVEISQQLRQILRSNAIPESIKKLDASSISMSILNILKNTENEDIKDPGDIKKLANRIYNQAIRDIPPNGFGLDIADTLLNATMYSVAKIKDQLEADFSKELNDFRAAVIQNIATLYMDFNKNGCNEAFRSAIMLTALKEFPQADPVIFQFLAQGVIDEKLQKHPLLAGLQEKLDESMAKRPEPIQFRVKVAVRGIREENEESNTQKNKPG